MPFKVEEVNAFISPDNNNTSNNNNYDNERRQNSSSNVYIPPLDFQQRFSQSPNNMPLGKNSEPPEVNSEFNVNSGVITGTSSVPEVPNGYPFEYQVPFPLTHTTSNNSSRSQTFEASNSGFSNTTNYLPAEYLNEFRDTSGNLDFSNPGTLGSGVFDSNGSYHPTCTYDSPMVSPLTLNVEADKQISEQRRITRSKSERTIKEVEQQNITRILLPNSQPKERSQSIDTRKRPKRRIKSESNEPELFQPLEKGRSRSAHNVIEQRYRNRINAKFSTLLYSVPTLKVVARTKSKSEGSGESSGEDSDSFESSDQQFPTDLEGLKPARKLNKGTILGKSIEYIRFLELKNLRMKQEHNELLMKVRMLGINVDDSYTTN